MVRPDWRRSLLLLVAGLLLLAGLAAPGPAATAAPAVAEPFAAYYYAHDGGRLLGPPVTDLEGSVQYFEKGRLEDHRDQGLPAEWAIMYGRLGAELIEQGLATPVAGESGPTYADLRAQAAPERRQPPPEAVDDVQGTTQGAFVPYDSELRAAPGYIVPDYFWTYITAADLFPGGWLHDVGLPLTPAFAASLRKGDVERTVIIQAFERTILTYDPLNPVDWQVERANVGLHAVRARQEPTPTPVPPTPTPTPTPAVAEATFPAWRGEYFTNPDVLGDPALTRADPALDFDWGGGAPAAGLPADGFSVRWTTTLVVDSRDNYEFTVDADGLYRVWVDGNDIIDRWTVGGRTKGYIRLDVGRYPVRVEYRDLGGAASIRLSVDTLGHIRNWRGAYYANTNQQGAPEFIRDDRDINFNWGDRGPGSGMRRNNFSVRWTRSLKLDPGVYRFTVTADDGVRLTVAGVTAIDNWETIGPAATYTRDITIGSGSTEVRLDYRDRGGPARVKLTYTRIG